MDRIKDIYNFFMPQGGNRPHRPFHEDTWRKDRARAAKRKSNNKPWAHDHNPASFHTSKTEPYVPGNITSDDNRDDLHVEQDQIIFMENLKNVKAWTWSSEEECRHVIEDLLNELRSFKLSDLRSATDPSDRVQRYYACMNLTQARIIDEFERLRFTRRQDFYVNSLIRACNTWIIASLLHRIMENEGFLENTDRFEREFWYPKEKKANGLSDIYAPRDYFTPNWLKYELATGRYMDQPIETDRTHKHFKFLTRLYGFIQGLEPRDPDIFLDIRYRLKTFLSSARLKVEKWKEYDERVEKRKELEDTKKRQKEERERQRHAGKPEISEEDEDPDEETENTTETQEKEAEYNDWDLDNPDPEVERVEQVDPSDSESDSEDENSDSGDHAKKFNPDYEYIPDSTSKLMDWRGNQLETFDKTLLPRNEHGGIFWEEVPKNVLLIMLVRMISLYVSNMRRNKKRNYFLKMLEHQLKIKKSYLDHDKRVMEQHRNRSTPTHGTGSTP